MTTSTPVPADVEPSSIIDLLQDCREVTGVLGGAAPVVRLPAARAPRRVDIDALTASGLDGYGDYGS
ncbi:MAG: hypothetical protein JWN88_2822 [Frankiales bacterium]|jgi:hypothetical protein|nr:hypothetical protein [Frankiales bacterium]